jgi:GT2 family glycosyltransferase
MVVAYPQVFVIVLTWNHLSDTLECLRSLASLEYPSYRIVIVDNGSEDNTPRIVREKFPNVVVIENERNLGYAEGNNEGIRYALNHSADFILLLNNDTIVDRQFVTHLVTAAQEHPEAAAFGPKIYFSDQPDHIMFAGARWDQDAAVFRYIGQGEQETGKYDILSETETLSGCAMLLRAELVSAVGLLDTRFFLLWEETDLCSRIRRYGYKLLFVPIAKVWHKGSRSFGGLGPQYTYYHTRNRLLWIEKNLRGGAKRHAYLRCAKEIYWRLLALRQLNRSRYDEAIIRAHILGWIHYAIRQFGSQWSEG